ncbi:CubicO group peptidase, beta-lactamase class C family [Marivirga sericea]|uniref:CubicO group peptidase, beta-lactamase class C family n=1 Tax=Marivirga sericea TaxID=1028 RepID=A0A1X7JKX7_9BACT|nr:serine hydrolase domain-containing protein [Marivirga sericea]SMG28845.1 CubicO group peptidase, beta-lactamase class C family [Marivirga sericea]
MRNLIFILLLTLTLSCQNSKNEKANRNQNNSNDLIVESFHKKMDSLYNTGMFNGYSTTIVDTTGILYNKGFGYADLEHNKKYTEHTIINIASVSKVFIGVALLKAQELNYLNLNDPINKHLPFEVINPNFPEEVITVKHLATHTSAIVDTDQYMETCYVNLDNIPIEEGSKKKYELYYQNPSDDWKPLDAYLKKILVNNEEFYDASTFAKRKPGTKYEYSNIGAALCALVIESAVKKPFDKFTDQYIFKPLAMNATSWNFEEVDRSEYSKLYADDNLLPYYRILSYPDGGLITSSTDLGYFLQELIKGYSGKGNILEDDSYQELFKPQLEQKAFSEKKNKGFNVGFFLELEADYNEIGHTGGDPGVNSFMYFNTETKTGRILITNTDSQKENSGEVFYGIWNTLVEYKTH